MVSRERKAMFVVLGLGALGCLLGLAAPPSTGPGPGAGGQLADLIRILTTTALAVTLVLGPGLAARAVVGRDRLGLAFVAVPGLALLAATGGLAWALAGPVEPRTACFAVLAPVLGLLFGGLIGAGEEDLLEPEERRVLLIAGAALGFAIARAVWSLGPEGELYSGTVSRTLEVGDRPDSRIPFVIVQLVAHGTHPYSSLGASYFAPYNFSSRGPLAGLASAPVVLMAGGKPPVQLPDQPWRAFDAQGFMAYRLAMMTFATTAFVSLWDLVRRLADWRAARLALILAVTTPFLVHEVWFTWPKLLAASFVLMAAICIFERRALAAGLLLGVAYLVHPGGLLGITALGLLALWPLKGASLRRPDIRAALLLVAGTAVSLLAWRLVNGDHYTQSTFLEYFRMAGNDLHPSPAEWLVYRAASVVNTFVPMALLLFGNSVSINVVGGRSPAIIHFFIQYWDGVPFGVGIVFAPLLAISIWRAWKLWRWPVFATVMVPVVCFAIYWGNSKTGLLREGLQAWVLALLAVAAMQQRAADYPWLRSKPVRVILTLRPAELALIAVGPTLATTGALIGRGARVNDVVALTAMAGFAAFLAALTWRTTPERLEWPDRPLLRPAGRGPGGGPKDRSRPDPPPPARR